MADRAPDTGNYIGYVNVSFLIYNYEIINNGEDITSTTNFAITNYGDYIQLSLNLGELSLKLSLIQANLHEFKPISQKAVKMY